MPETESVQSDAANGGAATNHVKSQAKRGATRKTTKPRKGRSAKRSKKKGRDKEPSARGRRAQRPFPASSFEEALEFARSAYEYGSGQPVRRLSLFDHLGKSPESSASRQWITNANKYGLIKGGYQAETLELTSDGIKAIGDDSPPRERARARVRLAVEEIEPFKSLYERFQGTKLPARNALIDAIKEFGVPNNQAEEAVDTFIVNLRYVGLLQTLSGAERIVTVDHMFDSLPVVGSTHELQRHSSGPSETTGTVTSTQAEWDKTCFYVAPIGDEASEARKHSDLVLGSIVEPALERFSLEVRRADAIDKPGLITRQVIEHLLRARLVIVDLSFHNPNVFYELAIRHAARLPVVQIIRRSDRIPFDVSQSRTVVIDTTDIYSLVPKIATYRSEIGNQVRRALDNPDLVDNPISAFFPGLQVSLDGNVSASN